ncbi:MAG: histidine phosphatase family protein [Nitrospira bacterium HGW-Nitrospira-1]|nr:MAG: histidine phosphatase family protein [Nitrospira bacterium HGW-Nitrospira-1]
MVTTLYLVRHGETEGSETKRYKGSIDVPLSEKGIEQMEQLAEYLNRSYKSYTTYSGLLNAVYCSPLSRALKSAEIIAETHGLKPVAIEDLRERSFGIWEGMTFSGIKEKYPEDFEAWANNPLRYSPIGGESTIKVSKRVINALNMILENHKNGNNPSSSHFSKAELGGFSGENIAIIAHGGVNRVILCRILGIPLENIFRIEQDYAAVNIIEFWDKYPVVKLINGQASLEYKW